MLTTLLKGGKNTGGHREASSDDCTASWDNAFDGANLKRKMASEWELQSLRVPQQSLVDNERCQKSMVAIILTSSHSSPEFAGRHGDKQIETKGPRTKHQKTKGQQKKRLAQSEICGLPGKSWLRWKMRLNSLNRDMFKPFRSHRRLLG